MHLAGDHCLFWEAWIEDALESGIVALRAIPTWWSYGTQV